MDALKNLAPQSKKLWVFGISLVVFIVNGLAGHPLDEGTIESVLALSASYLVGQGIADHGWQGAITGAKRAAKGGEATFAAVKEILAAKAGTVEAKPAAPEATATDETAKPLMEG